MFIHNLFILIILIAPICSTTVADEIYISPLIYDVQNNIETAIRIKGLASTIDMIKQTTCNVMDLDSQIVMNVVLNPSDAFTVMARFETPFSLGAFKIQCSKFGSMIKFNGNFLLVNSLYLIIGSVEPSSIKLGESVSFRVEIFNLTEPVSLICYLTDGEDYIVLPTNLISGNKLSTWVTCPEYKLNKAAEYHITVVYSTDTIDAMMNSNNYKVITVQADHPKIIKSGFTKDVRTIWFQFDQNVEGPELCNDIFTSITLIQIGYDSLCWFSTNHLVVLLGNIKTIKDNKIIVQFSSSNGIRTYKSWDNLSLFMLYHEIIVPILPSEITVPMYWLYGPRQYCNVGISNDLEKSSINQSYESDCIGSQLIHVFPIGSLMLKYNTILSIDDISSSVLVTTDETSHRASMLRDSVRNIVKAIKRQNFTSGICLISTLMLPHVEYTLEVLGTNVLNQSGPKNQLKFKLIETNGTKSQPKLQIISRPTFSIGSEAVFETVLYPVCKESIEDEYNLKYSWYFVNENIKQNFIGINGPTLILDTKGLSRDKNYTIGCELYNEISTIEKKVLAIAKDEILFRVESFDVKTIIVPQQIVVAFGRTLHLKVKNQNYVPMSDIRYKWLCKTTSGDDCLVVGNHPDIKVAMNKSTSSELVIREMTLQPGRYYFVVQILLSNIPIDSAVSVVVVSFESGPHIMFFWPDKNFNPSTPLPPGSSIVLAATVSYLTSGCITMWTTSSESGYSYLSSNYMGGKNKVVEEFTPGRNETFSRNVRLVMTLPNKIIRNTNFLLKLNIHCASLKHSIFGIVPVSIINPPHSLKLEVTPTEGIGLITKFKFVTGVAYDTKPNHPIRYSFGFYLPKLTAMPIYFYSSIYWLQTESILPSINSSLSKIKTVLKVCNIYESCNIIEGPEITIRPIKFSDAYITYLIQKITQLLVKQMMTEFEAYVIIIMTTIKTFENRTYKKISQEIYNLISTEINNIIERLSFGREYIPFALTFLDSISRTLFILPKFDSLVVSKSLILLRDRIYTKLINHDNIPTSSNIFDDNRYIFKNVNSHRQNVYSEITISADIVKLFLQVSEIIILNRENESSVLNEKKEILGNIENYAKHMCLTLNEHQEIYVGSLVGSFSIQYINSISSIESIVELPLCNSDFHKKCIKQKSKITIDKNLFGSQITEFPLCFMSFHFYDDFFTQVYGNNNEYLKRHSGLFGFKVMKTNVKYNNENIVEINSLNIVNVIEIPLQSTTDSQLECRYWSNAYGWTNESCKLLGVLTKSFSKFASCECPAFRYYGVFSVDSANIPLDNSASDSTHNTVVYGDYKNKIVHNSSILRRSLSDLYVSFKVNGNPVDFYDQNLKDLENSLSQQLTESIKYLSTVMKELKIVMSEPVYITLHLMQTINITTDESIQDLVKKLGDGSLILYDLHRYRLYVPEQPLKIMQPRNLEFNNMGKNIALFFAIFVAFLACFVFGSILIKRHQLLTDISAVQQNVKKEENSIRRPKYKKLESNELIEQNMSSEQRFRHFNNNVELSDSGITLHSDKTQVNLLKQLH